MNPSTGQRAVAAIRAHLAASGTSWAKLTGDVVASIIDAAEAAEKPKRKPKMTTEEWLESQRQDPANEGVNIDLELKLAQKWCRDNHRLCTQKFFERWLLKSERVIAPGRVAINALPELQGWRLFLAEREAQFGLAEEQHATWDELPRSTREVIHGQKHRLQGMVEFARSDPQGWKNHLEQVRKQRGDTAA